MKKKALFLLSIIFIFTQTAYSQSQRGKKQPDTCESLLENYEYYISLKSSGGRYWVHQDISLVSKSMATLREKMEPLKCDQSFHDRVLKQAEKIKEIRLRSIEMMQSKGLFQEKGINLEEEKQLLSGSIANIPGYPFMEFFGQVVPSMNAQSDSSLYCTNRINESEAVNLDNNRNQDSIGWCYAYVAADLLSEKLGKEVSAVSLYSSGPPTVANIEDDLKTEGGIGGDVAYAAKRYSQINQGYCLEKDLPSDDFKFCTDLTYNDFLTNLVGKVKSNSLNRELENNRCFVNDLQAAFPGIDLRWLAQESAKPDKTRVIEAIYRMQCKNPIAKDRKLTIAQKTKRHTTPQALIDTISQQISKGSIAGIGYDYFNLVDPGQSGSHASTVIGRRKNLKTGECEFLVRNSWGKSCTIKNNPGLDCHKKCVGNDCRLTGNFWVTESKLKKSLEGVYYINE